MNTWLLPASAASFWVGLLAGPRWSGLVGPWGWLVIGVAALVSAWLATPRDLSGDPLRLAGLAPSPAPSVQAVAEGRSAPRGGTAAPAFGLAIIGVLALGIGWGGMAERRLEGSFLASLAPDRVTLGATVREDPRPTAFGWRAIVDVRSVSWSGGSVRLGERLWLSGDDEAPAVVRGDLIRAEGSLEVPDDPGFADLLHTKGAAAAMRVSDLERLGGAPQPFVRATQVVREVVGRSIRAVFPPREAGLLLGLALGDDSGLDPATERDFRATGLTHLLVVSGGNVAMVLGPVLGLATVLGLARVAKVVLGVTTVAFIVVLTGIEPSVLRAGTMATLVLVGMLLGRPRSTAVVLSGAVFVLLALDPLLVRNIAFQLSVAATAGMVALAGPFADRFERWVPLPVALAAGTTLAAQLGVSPILLYHFHAVPGITLLANVLAAPTVAPALLLGLVAAGAGIVSVPLGQVLGLAAQVPMRLLALIADLGGRAPVASVTSRGGLGVSVGGITVVVTITVMLRTGWRPPRRMLVLGVAALPLLVWASAVSKGPPSELTVRIFDVGQGDAALVSSPAGATMLVDGGPDDEQVAIELAALGVKRLDVVVASHPHADHITGLPTVLARFPVGVVLHPGCPTTSTLQLELDRAIVDEGVAVRTPAAGDTLTVGDLRVDVLSPDRCWSGTESDTNNDALVLRVSLGDAVVLFATEPEEPAQEAMLAAGVDLRADLLKVPHHGAATSVDAFFAAVGAEVAVVPVGENTYGHPVPSTLEAIATSGSAIYRSDHHGTVTVTFGSDGPVVTTERGPPADEVASVQVGASSLIDPGPVVGAAR